MYVDYQRVCTLNQSNNGFPANKIGFQCDIGKRIWGQEIETRSLAMASSLADYATQSKSCSFPGL